MAYSVPVCDSCNNGSQESVCIECDECYCQKCTKGHARQKATKSHTLLDTTNRDEDFNSSTTDNICQVCDDSERAVGLCLDCKHIFCNKCLERHGTQKVTKDHTTIAAKMHPAAEARNDTGSINFRKDSDSDARSITNASMAQVRTHGRGRYIGVYNYEFKGGGKGDQYETKVRGISILSDGRLVIADYKNKTLKLFQEQNMVTSRDIKDEPRGIAYIHSDDRVALTFSDKKEIRIYKFEKSKIRNHKTIKMKDKPFSIACHKNYLAVEVGEGGDGAISIIDVYGKERTNIPGYTRNFGQFTGNTIRIALDSTKEIVFVVDISNDHMHCIRYNGSAVWTVKIQGPRGIILHDDILFVASSFDNKILLLSVDAGIPYEFLDEDNQVKRPRYIAFQPATMQLAVEVDSGIKVYIVKAEVPQRDI